MHWKIWYDLPGIGPTDVGNIASVYTSDDGTWEEAPSQGVICVAVTDHTGAWGRFINGWNPANQCPLCSRTRTNEYFVKAPGDTDPQAVPELGQFIDKMVRLGHDRATIDRCVKYGRVTDQQRYNDITLLAGEDPAFERLTPRRRRADRT